MHELDAGFTIESLPGSQNIHTHPLSIPLLSIPMLYSTGHHTSLLSTHTHGSILFIHIRTSPPFWNIFRNGRTSLWLASCLTPMGFAQRVSVVLTPCDTFMDVM